VAARSKAWVCGRSLAGIARSNLAGDMDVCLLWVLLLSGRGLCDGPITRPECGVPECDLETATMRRPRPTRVVEASIKKKAETFDKAVILMCKWSAYTVCCFVNDYCIPTSLFWRQSYNNNHYWWHCSKTTVSPKYKLLWGGLLDLKVNRVTCLATVINRVGSLHRPRIQNSSRLVTFRRCAVQPILW
jgi:hypothetical protein